METILRSMSRQSRGRGGKDFAVFALKNVGAEQVEKNLRELFRVSGRNRFSEDAPVIVADERMNAIMVNANRSDRHAIEDLIRVLDSVEVPDFKTTQKSRRLSLKNSRAARIEIVLRDLYRTQMSSAGNRQPIPIPMGVSTDVAAALQTLNSVNAGPVLTVAVDEATNSILVKGPVALVDDVANTVLELDGASTEDQSRKLSIIALKRVNSDHARRAIDAIVNEPNRPRSRARSGGNR
ncbi:MAG: secretin N-terminal domain-containing protein [Planctomycetales bacterium]